MLRILVPVIGEFRVPVNGEFHGQNGQKLRACLLAKPTTRYRIIEMVLLEDTLYFRFLS